MPEELTEFIVDLLVALVTVATPFILAQLTLLLRRWQQFYSAKVSVEQDYLIRSIVALAVKSAEQSGLAGLIVDEAANKKQWALLQAQNWLANQGIVLDANDISARIEAAINDEVQKGPGFSIFPGAIEGEIEVNAEPVS